MVCIDKVLDGLCFDNLIETIMNTLLEGGGLTMKDLSKKLLCFGVDGVNVLQGGKT